MFGTDGPAEPCVNGQTNLPVSEDCATIQMSTFLFAHSGKELQQRCNFCVLDQRSRTASAKETDVRIPAVFQRETF